MWRTSNGLAFALAACGNVVGGQVEGSIESEASDGASVTDSAGDVSTADVSTPDVLAPDVSVADVWAVDVSSLDPPAECIPACLWDVFKECVPSAACFMTPEGTRCEPTTGWYSETACSGKGGCVTSVYQDGHLCYSLSFGGAAPFSGKLVYDSSDTIVGYMGSLGQQWTCSYLVGPIQPMPVGCSPWYLFVTPTTDCAPADAGTCERPF